MELDKATKAGVRRLMADSRARSEVPRRYFGSNAYNFVGSWVKKADAQGAAKWIRKGGGLARVVEIDQSPRYGRHRGQGAKWYEVWARPPRNSSFTMR